MYSTYNLQNPTTLLIYNVIFITFFKTHMFVLNRVATQSPFKNSLIFNRLSPDFWPFSRPYWRPLSQPNTILIPLEFKYCVQIIMPCRWINFIKQHSKARLLWTMCKSKFIFQTFFPDRGNPAFIHFIKTLKTPIILLFFRNLCNFIFLPC